MLALVAGLADPLHRQQAAQSLAAALGAEDLVVFTPDPAIGVLLPAPGFPQTLPEGSCWRPFLSACTADGEAIAESLPYPSPEMLRRAQGLASPDGSVLVLLGGTPSRAEIAEVRLLLPLLSAAFRGERVAAIAEGRAAVAQEAAAQARALAEALDRARRDLGMALSEAQTARHRFAQFMQHLPGLAWIKDQEGRYVYANDAALKAFSTSRDQLYGKTDENLFPPHTAAQFRESDHRAVVNGAGVQGIEALEYGDGTVHHSVVSRFAIPAADGTPAMIGGVAIDITKRQRAEDALRRQNERLRLLSEAAADLLAADDPEAMVRGLFERVKNHLGADTYFNFAVNETGDALTLVSYAGIPEEVARTITPLELGQAICGTVALERRPIAAARIQESDDPRAQLVKSFGLRAYACNPLIVGQRLLGTLSFASRTKDAFGEDELEFLQTLSHYVAAGYERVRLISRLREADRRKDEFLATLAHELRNPLAPLRNALQILNMNRVDADAAQHVRQMMDRQVDHLVRLVDDLLDVSRVMRGKIELRKEKIELASVVARAVETAQPLIEVQGHTLDISLPSESLLVDADAVRLAQVVSNLLTNAAKYTEANGQIWLTARREGNEAVLRVRDNGIGIAPDVLPHVFELFVQADHASTKAQGGLGIGLTLVKNLVQMHNGTVEAHSGGLGKGCEFTVRLPLVVQEVLKPVGTDDRDRPQQERSSSGHRLLVVDDNKDAGTTLAMLLRLQGHEVRVAHNGPSALELAASFHPHLIFLDIGMPKMDGYEVARRIRQTPGLENTVLAALTGWGQQEDRRRTAEAGFDHHLVKPPELKVLQELIAELPKDP